MIIEESNNIHTIISIDFIKIKEIKLTLDQKKLSDKEIIKVKFLIERYSNNSP